MGAIFAWIFGSITGLITGVLLVAVAIVIKPREFVELVKTFIKK